MIVSIFAYVHHTANIWFLPAFFRHRGNRASILTGGARPGKAEHRSPVSTKFNQTSSMSAIW